MTLISIEMRKWKRNKTLWGIWAIALLLDFAAIERAFSISRSSPLMDSFGDLYTMAFKNLVSLYMPIALGIFITTLFFDEKKNDTMKSLLIVPVSKAALFFSKVVVTAIVSLGLCVCGYVLCIVGGFIAGGFPDMNTQMMMDAAKLFLVGAFVMPVAMLPVMFLATFSKGYVLPFSATLLYLAPVIAAPLPLMGIHPLASAMVIYSSLSPVAAEMVYNWVGRGRVNASPVACLISLVLVGAIFAIASMVSLKKQSY